MSEQFHISHGYEHEYEARRASRDLALTLIDRLHARGYTNFHPPDRLVTDEGAWDVFADCRILVKYISPPAATSLAGLFAVRVDTVADHEAHA